jgi:hypothetical protein
MNPGFIWIRSKEFHGVSIRLLPVVEDISIMLKHATFQSACRRYGPKSYSFAKQR